MSAATNPSPQLDEATKFIETSIQCYCRKEYRQAISEGHKARRVLALSMQRSAVPQGGVYPDHFAEEKARLLVISLINDYLLVSNATITSQMKVFWDMYCRTPDGRIKT